MSRNRVLITGSLLIPFLLGGCSSSVSFKDDVQPILDASCISCHDGEGEGSVATALDLNDYTGVMQGTSLGRVVEPGDKSSSTLYLVVAHKVDPKIQMLPHHPVRFPSGEGKPLSEAQITLIGDWIDQGAENN